MIYHSLLAHKESLVMSGKADEVKGRIKEGAGAITDVDKLRREGKTDQAVGKVKQAVNKVAEKTKDAVDRAKDAMHGESLDSALRILLTW
jgi:uncharacterized protein YjbJ (UPF0337 family)